MLKIIKTSLLVVVLSLSLNVTAQTNIDLALKNICTIVKVDDKGELRKKMKKVQSAFRLKLQDYYSGISCGGNSLIRTAFLNNAVGAGTLLIKKMPRSQLNSEESDGQTIRAWVSENGFMKSELAVVLNSRI